MPSTATARPGFRADTLKLPLLAQLSQVIKELKKTSYRPRMCVLGSRHQMCVHKDISQLSGAAQNVACRAAVASRSCAHYRAVEAHLREDTGAPLEPLDIEELIQLGQAGARGGCGPCPYFLSRERSKARTCLLQRRLRRACGNRLAGKAAHRADTPYADRRAHVSAVQLPDRPGATPHAGRG